MRNRRQVVLLSIVVVTMMAACNSTEPSSSDSTPLTSPAESAVGVSSATPARSSAAQAATKVTLVSPVAADGTIKNGFTVVDQRPGLADCHQTRFISDFPGVYRCGATADSLAACWPVGEGAMVCMRDPDETEAIRFLPDETLGPYDETDVIPRPWKMTLTDGSVCIVRLGGSWDGRPDGLTGAYSCDGQSPFVLVDGSSVAVDRSGPTWTVLVGELGSNATDTPKKMAVASAVLAGAPGS